MNFSDQNLFYNFSPKVRGTSLASGNKGRAAPTSVGFQSSSVFSAAANRISSVARVCLRALAKDLISTIKWMRDRRFCAGRWASAHLLVSGMNRNACVPVCACRSAWWWHHFLWVCLRGCDWVLLVGLVYNIHYCQFAADTTVVVVNTAVHYHSHTTVLLHLS